MFRTLSRTWFVTGWWGIPGGPPSKSTKVHVKRKGERHPACGSKVTDGQEWQWCAGGIVEEWVECGRCEALIKRLRREYKEAI